MPTQEETRAALKLVIEVGREIHDLGEVPAGTLYATLMTAGLKSTSDFDALIGVLVRAGVVERKSPNSNFDLIRWIGPKNLPA